MRGTGTVRGEGAMDPSGCPGLPRAPSPPRSGRTLRSLADALGAFLGFSERGGEAHRCPGTSLPSPQPAAHLPTPGICSLGSGTQLPAANIHKPQVVQDLAQAPTRQAAPRQGPETATPGPAHVPTSLPPTTCHLQDVQSHSALLLPTGLPGRAAPHGRGPGSPTSDILAASSSGRWVRRP